MTLISCLAHCAAGALLTRGIGAAQAQVEVCANTAAEILNGFGVARGDTQPAFA